MRRSKGFWIVKGKLRLADKPRATGDTRTVIFEHEGFPSQEATQEALLYWWSGTPHTAEIISIQKFEPENTFVLIGEEKSA